MDNFQLSIMKDAIEFANQMRKPENVDILGVWGTYKSEHDILDAPFYSEERRTEWRNMFKEEMPANIITAEQAGRLAAIEHAIDEKSGHSGSSWGYMVAAAKVLAGFNRSHFYMNWINQAEEIQPGCTAPLSEKDIETNNSIVMSDHDAYLYDAETKTYHEVLPADL